MVHPRSTDGTPRSPSTPRTPRTPRTPPLPAPRARSLVLLAGSAGVLALGGCAADSFIDPSKVGRWEPTPTSVPILERLAAIEGSAGSASIETSPVRPEDLIPEVEAYRMGPGDGMDIRIQDFYREGVEESFIRLIDPRGFIDLPQVGSVYVDGLSVDDVQLTIARTLVDKSILKDPIVAVQVTERRRLTFNVIGSVSTPGLYAIPRPDYRLLEGLTAAGRFSESVQSVYVIRQIALTDKVTRGSGPRPAGSARPALPVPAGPGAGEPAPPPPAAKPKESVIDLIDELTKPKPAQGTDTPATPPAEEPAAPPPPAVMRTRGSALTLVQPDKGTEPPIDLDDPKRPPRPAKPAPGPATGAAKPTPAPPAAPAAPPPPVPMPAPEGTVGDAPALDESALNLPDDHWVFRDGRWMKVAEARLLPPQPVRPITPPPGAVVELPEPPTEGAPGEPGSTPPLPLDGSPSPVPSVPGAENLVTQRVIEVPVGPLLAGSAQFNIIIRPGDVIRVPSPAEGIVYITGEVQRPGTFNLPSAGRYTIKRAIASAGGLSSTAIPEKLDLTRMVGPDRQATIRLNLRAIEEGTQPDVFLKPDDIINVGTNFWALPLAVVRNGFRASYGFGFVLDRNFQGDVFGRDQATGGGF